ncbi:Ppx/GppA family phosphatase [Brevibacillus sp. SYP-B805]|uniref:Ppx/GppA phosphatase family protein n=1 Tax=Brevibacillus sp. SYP-B805 TaxID=1578199 RepID=UPI0013EBAF51|nr:Ppx/GppA phosphatase family protein [Brevibacillus sp. SYP-B805]NGQ96562.1 Ppx/GppA family phosphatase [Brevibacillus sp. SYP-B805]
MEKIAIIDMGSNTIRMVIFQVAEHAYHLIDDTKETVRLSEYMGAEMTLKPAAVDRALAALQRFMKLCRSRDVKTVIPVATAAVRGARNREEFLGRVEQETGLAFRVLSGEEEAYYGFLGVINGFREECGYTLDIGGGSSEITLFEGRALSSAISMPFGALTLTERFRSKAGDGRVEAEELRRYLRTAFGREAWLGSRRGLPVIGLGGTVRNIARVHRHLIHYPLESAHQYAMSKEQVDETLRMLSGLSLRQLQELPGLSKDRADLIVAGGMIIQTLMEAVEAPILLISGNGLREGLFYEHMQQRSPEGRGDDVLMNEVVNMMRYYHVDERHATHVAHLALRLFDELAPLHGMGEEERLLLAAAAHLHDVGVAVSFYEWQRHTFYVLLHSKMAGLTHRERLMTALIASFKNRKKMREISSPYHGLLRPGDEETVQKLGILLLLARALDRSRSSDIQDLTCCADGKRVRIRVQSINPDIRLELKEASEFQQRFAKAFGMEYDLQADISGARQR